MKNVRNVRNSMHLLISEMFSTSQQLKRHVTITHDYQDHFIV